MILTVINGLELKNKRRASPKIVLDHFTVNKEFYLTSYCCANGCRLETIVIYCIAPPSGKVKVHRTAFDSALPEQRTKFNVITIFVPREIFHARDLFSFFLTLFEKSAYKRHAEVLMFCARRS